MSPLDLQLINRKAKLIEDDLKLLAEDKPKSYSEYLNNIRVQLKVERLLERIIGRVIDINYHILSEEYQIVPSEYHESFILLGKKGVIPKKLSEKLAKSAGLRNILAHEYDEINPKQVYQSINITLTQVPEYLKAILDKL